jgi:hypothetical protein
MDRRVNSSMLLAMMRTAGPSWNVATGTGIISGSSSRRMMPVNWRACGALPANSWIGPRVIWARGLIGSPSTTGIPSIPISTSSCAAGPITAPTSSSAGITLELACGRERAILLPENSARDRSVRSNAALRRRLLPNAGPGSIGYWQGVVDLRLEHDAGRDPLREIRIGRMRTLERLELAEPAGSARWVLAADAEQRLRVLGERGDIIRRLHKSLARDGASRAPSSWALEGEAHGEPVIGRLVARGHDDELRGTAFAVVDGIDGRVHHLKLPDLATAGDGPIGGIVELRRFEDAKGRQRIALAVCSDLNSAPRFAPHLIGGSTCWRNAVSSVAMEIRSLSAAI